MGGITGIYTVFIETNNAIDLLRSFYTLKDAQEFMALKAEKLMYKGGEVLIEEQDHIGLLTYNRQYADLWIQKNTLSSLDYLITNNWLL